MAQFNKNRLSDDWQRMRRVSEEAARHVERKVVHKMPKTRWIPQWLWAGAAIAIASFVFILGAFAAWASVMTIPAINNFENRKISESTKIYDRTGNVVLYDVHGSVRRTAVPLTDVSPNIQRATISIEDADFYTHHGFRPAAFARAVLADILIHIGIKDGYTQGGSTITQQVVKNALLTQRKTITRKLQEIILALRLERTYSKDEILETYLNETGYGGTIYGVQEASQYFFGVDAKDVDLAQASYLAAIPQAPTHLSPYGNYKSDLDNRKNLVLFRMETLGYITKDERTAAAKEAVQFRDEAEAGIKAPHFVFYIRDYLEQKYGADTVQDGGLRVITTLDYDLQEKAEATVAKWAPQMLANFNASNESMVAIDPKTGQILAMVGSKGYFDKTIDGAVNVAASNRQPGSSFKPFVYATAFEKGYTPDTVVFDLQTQFSTHCEPQDTTNDTPPCYSPQNYDGTFKGPLKLRDALAISENIPAIKVLYLAGIGDSIKTARDLGITTLGDANQYGLTLVLGGGEVKLLEMTGAYSVFANDGVKNPPTGILRVEDKSGNVLESYEQKPVQVLDPQIARLINDVLSDNVARTPEFGADSPLNFPGLDVADKTGTTNDFHDVWVLGYTPGIAVGAWAGNNDNSPMAKKIAAFIIAPMWHEFMAYALQKYSSDSDVFVPPSPDTDSLPPVLMGNWNTNPTQGIHDILFWVDKSNPRGAPLNPASDSQFQYWDYPVQIWAASNGQFTGGSSSTYPGNIGPIVSSFSITSPATGAIIPWSGAIPVTVAYPAGMQILQVTYFLNGSLAGSSIQPPFAVSVTPNGHGPTTIRAVAATALGSVENSVTFTVQ
ncbi:transglycosylase domain-containing protein [Candidatus Kaiserbacteria bacterium]|nr:transglycosylase domain-containing protein [Candidatus Kaiserbacteria bacterium]